MLATVGAVWVLMILGEDDAPRLNLLALSALAALTSFAGGDSIVDVLQCVQMRLGFV